jgi:hypothetical protein
VSKIITIEVITLSRKANVESYIRFQTKTDDGKKYATFCPSDRRHGGKDVYLGIAIKENEGIFFNRKHGFFRFTIEGGRSELSPAEIEYLKFIEQRGDIQTTKPLTLDFGDAWLFEHVLEESGIKQMLEKVFDEDKDTILSLIAFKVLDSNANRYARRWFDGSYAQYLYPSAKLCSPRISEFMERLGKEETKRKFFDIYIPYLRQLPNVSENVLIDSTGLPNDIHFEYSQLNNHNGVISREARLIYVVERNTGLPVYFRYVAGNIVDVITLRVTINHLKAQGMDVKHGILDAGYCSEKNIKDLFNNDIPFLIRLPNNALAKNLISKHGTDVRNPEYALEYGERLLFMKRVSENLFGHECHAYIAIDYERMSGEQEHYYRKAIKNRGKGKKKSEKSKDPVPQFGYFVLVSSQKLEPSEVMPLYYTRQTIEQTFDFAKNDVALLPVRNHKDETFRGHLLLSFMATIALITVKRVLKTRKKLAMMPAVQALQAMRYIKANVFPHTLVTSEPNKYANLIINELKLDVPGKINL